MGPVKTRQNLAMSTIMHLNEYLDVSGSNKARFGSSKTSFSQTVSITDRSKAVLLLWFLYVTRFVCMYMAFRNMVS